MIIIHFNNIFYMNNLNLKLSIDSTFKSIPYDNFVVCPENLMDLPEVLIPDVVCKEQV